MGKISFLGEFKENGGNRDELGIFYKLSRRFPGAHFMVSGSESYHEGHHVSSEDSRKMNSYRLNF